MKFINEASLLFLFVIFILASLLVWFSGTKLSKTTGTISQKTGTADAVLGSLLLGGVTSLPEVATTITASSLGNADLSINNLFGGVALQITILCAGDFIIKNRSITSSIEGPVLQAQAMVGILLLSASSAIMIAGDITIGRMGLGSVIVLILFVSGFYLVTYLEKLRWWQSDPEWRDGISQVKQSVEQKINAGSVSSDEQSQLHAGPGDFKLFGSKELYRLIGYGCLVVAGGYIVVRCGESIADKSGINSGLVGALFIALATSLPELSTTITAVRLGRYQMAFSNILGTNIYTIGFIFIADVFFAKGAILSEVGKLALFGAALGMILTAIYAIGLSMRYKKTVCHFGYDSLLVLLMYISGMIIMYNLVQ